MLSGIPVITIDGPSGTGKGTISQLLAKKLAWHYLDSGAIYRVLALAALQENLDLSDEFALANLASRLPMRFVEQGENFQLYLAEEEVGQKIRSEECSKVASLIAAFPKVREALLERQRMFRQAPGLVTDGRDMGTIVFPDAVLKIFLEASEQERATRRFNQLQKLGIDASIDAILQEQRRRDERDRTRSVAPLVPAKDAVLLDTTGLTVEQTLQRVFELLPK